MHNIRFTSFLFCSITLTNNAAEGYNYRMFTIFPPHPHIYEFIRRLKDEHEYQHHKAEESQVQVKKRKYIYEKIDDTVSVM